MNIQVNARQYSTGAEVKQAYQQIRERFYGKTKPVNWKPAPPPEPEPEPQPVVHVKKEPHRWPDWMVRPTYFDAHVIEYRCRVHAGSNPLRVYASRRCEEHGMTFEEARRRCRKRHVVDVKHTIMWEIKTGIKPSTSYPELGRMFNIHHTSALHAVQKLTAERGRFIEEDVSEEVIAERLRCEKFVADVVTGKATAMDALRKIQTMKDSGAIR